MASTLEQFYDDLMDLFEQKPDRDLKPFLLTLYRILPEYKDQTASFELFLEIIVRGLLEEPIPIKNDWLAIKQAPSGNRLVRKFTNPDIFDSGANVSDLDDRGIEFTFDVLKFQASEVTRMNGNQLENPMRFFGVISDTGHDWYNFTAHGVLECGTRCMIDNQESTENLSWSFIGSLLEDGRVYE
jgi:hypothetical protein